MVRTPTPAFVAIAHHEKTQHYKHRNPPWVKLHIEILDDYDFGTLNDDSKWHAVALILLASRIGNRLPNDSEWLRKHTNSQCHVDVKALLRIGFLIPLDFPDES